MADNREEINLLLLIDPSDLDEKACAEVGNKLLAASKKIDSQLSAKKRSFADGSPMTTQQYRNWRSKAITAKNHIENQYRNVKERTKAIRRGKHGSETT